MRVEELRRGHWFVIAILLGAALAWLNGFWGSTPTQTNAQSQLEMLLYQQPTKGGDGTLYPQVNDITIYPSIQAGFAVQRSEGKVFPRKSVVTYGILTAVPEKKAFTYKPAVSLVDDPYRPGGRPGSNPNLTAADYLKEMSANRDWIKYRYAWWAEPRWSYTLWIGGCVLVLGIIWPTVQSRLVAAGYGRPPEEREQRESLWKRLFSRGPKSSSYSSGSGGGRATASNTTLSEEDLERIAKMEADLAGFVKTGDQEAGGEVDEAAAPQIRKLDGGPAEVKQAPEAPKQEHDYGGEFYPTEAHAKKKPEAGK